MAGKTVVNTLQLGDSGTATQNFVLKTNADGTLTLARGNDGATSQDILTVDSSGNVQLTKTSQQSMVRLNTANGYGSTNTTIRRFTNTVTNQGSDITYADSASLGATFTINTNGVYAISFTDNFTVASTAGLSVNSSQLTTGISGINIGNYLASSSSAAANFGANVSYTGYFSATDVIRAHCSATSTGTSNVQFTIVRVS